jgi:hypothetical protein
LASVNGHNVAAFSRAAASGRKEFAGNSSIGAISHDHAAFPQDTNLAEARVGLAKSIVRSARRILPELLGHA